MRKNEDTDQAQCNGHNLYRKQRNQERKRYCPLGVGVPCLFVASGLGNGARRGGGAGFLLLRGKFISVGPSESFLSQIQIKCCSPVITESLVSIVPLQHAA